MCESSCSMFCACSLALAVEARKTLCAERRENYFFTGLEE